MASSVRHVTVKGSWMKACGLGEADATFPIWNVKRTLAGTFYEVERDGRIWTVWDIRLAIPGPSMEEWRTSSGVA